MTEFDHPWAAPTTEMPRPRTRLAEIHRAAMSKLNPPGGRVVREDGKICKPPGFVPPDLSGAVR